MSDGQLIITPQTKVGDLLRAYPQLEEVLIAVAPAFKKLRNPVLLRTVAKVTSLAQAARVGNVSVVELVQQLRRTVGQPEYEPGQEDYFPDFPPGPAPAWFDQDRVKTSFDARRMIDDGEQPIGRVLGDLEKLPTGEIFELITPFEPAPLIDKAKAKGFSFYTCQTGATEYRTYFSRA